MSTKISREFNFQAGIYFNDSFLINFYNINLIMFVMTDDVREQNVALERIKFIISECLENSVFVNFAETKIIDLYNKAGLRVCEVPEEPFDQIVGAVLLNKFNAITENRLVVTDIHIQSVICDNVMFYISNEDEVNWLFGDNSWWKDNSPMISEPKKKVKKDKIVELKKESLDWNSLGLCWQEKPNSKSNGEIVFIPLDK